MPDIVTHDKCFGHLHYYLSTGDFRGYLPGDYTSIIFSGLSEDLKTVLERNLTLDYVASSKKGIDGSHFRILHASGWTIPNLEKAYRELCEDTNCCPEGCGIFYHLYCDHYLITTELAPIAQRDRTDNTVGYKGKVYDLPEFQKFLYASYAENFAGCVDYYDRLLSQIPDTLPPFGRYPGLEDGWKNVVHHFAFEPHEGYKLFSPEDLNILARDACKLFVGQYPDIIERLKLSVV